MASALKTKLEHVNVLISDWRPLALQSYLVAVKNSRQVGFDVVTLLQWLEVMKSFILEKKTLTPHISLYRC